jgi:signal transduction histidine kinase/ligand-binding sensor domain-containing protein
MHRAGHGSEARRVVAVATSLLASFSILPAQSRPQSNPYVATVWGTEQGLPQNSVNAILQDHEGYLWLGTFGGLARFDGQRFTVFDSANTPGFGGARILAVCESRTRVLWLGTTEGLIRFDNGVARTFTERDGLPSAFVSSVRQDAEGKIWINTSRGVARVVGTNPEPYPTLGGKAVAEFYLQARDGSMWFRSGRDVVRFGADGSTETLHAGKPSGFLVREARDGSVWVAFRDENRLVRYYHGTFSDVPLPRVERREFTAEYTEAFAISLENDADGTLLLLIPAGLIRIVDGRLSAPESLPLPRNGSELPKVRSFVTDREGNLWVGTIGTGLVRLRRAPLIAYGKGEGLSDESFNAIFQDRDGRLWLGGDSLYWSEGNEFHLVPRVKNVLAIAQTRDGDMWFGGYGGLYRWRSGVLTEFKIEAPGVKAIFEDRQGTLWVGALKQERPGGLYRFREGKFEQVPGISDVSQIVEDRNDGFWVVGVEGLFLFRGGKMRRYDRTQGLPDHSDDMRQDSTGTLWLASYGGGLARFRDGRFKTITTRNGLPNNMLVGIVDDGKGNLWISSNQNIFRLSLKEANDVADGKIGSLLPVSYGLGEGMRSSESNHGSPAGLKTADGRIWFPTLRGVVAIDPASSNGLAPPVIVEEAWAGSLALGREGETRVPPGNNTFDFRFTALSLGAPEKVRFKYRLDPYDKNWVDSGTVRTAHYTNMTPGDYTFRVIAANSFGIWNDQGATVNFVLRPHFYQTVWFYLVWAAAFLGLLCAGYWYRLRQIRRAYNLRLAGQVDERLRVARELHDTLLQSFQGLIPVFQAARNLLPTRPDRAAEVLDEGLEDAGDAIVEGRSAIQNLRANPSLDGDLESLLNAVGAELTRARKTEESPPAFRVIVEGSRHPLSPLVQDEIYRIGREMLRNAFRHARAGRIEVEIRYDSRAFKLRVRDDGIGMDSSLLKGGAVPGHWGLAGMHERARKMGGRLEIWSESGAGTEEELSVPARVAYAKASRAGIGNSTSGSK